MSTGRPKHELEKHTQKKKSPVGNMHIYRVNRSTINRLDFSDLYVTFQSTFHHHL